MSGTTGPVGYAAYGKTLAGLGLDSTAPVGKSGEDVVGGALMFVLYFASLGVTLAFQGVLKALTELNPFRLLFAGVKQTVPDSWSQAMVGSKPISEDSKIAPIANWIGTWYKILYDTSWQVIIPLFLGIVIISALMLRHYDYKTKLRKWGIRMLFITVGIPMLGATYTSALNSMTKLVDNGGASLGATRVVASNYVDFRDWALNMRLASGCAISVYNGSSEASEHDKYTDGMSRATLRDQAYCINTSIKDSSGNSLFPGLGFSTTTPASTTQATAQLAVDGTSDVLDGSKESTSSTRSIRSSINMMMDLMRGQQVNASDFESGIKGELTTLRSSGTPLKPLDKEKGTTNDDIIASWFTKFSDPSSMDGSDANDNPLLSVKKDTGMTYSVGTTSSVQVQDPDDADATGGDGPKKVSVQGTNYGQLHTMSNAEYCGYKVVDASGSPMACNMSPLSMYNYLNTKFGSNSATVFSSVQAQSANSREQHNAVTQIGAGASSLMYWGNSVTLLFAFAVIGWSYALSILVTSIKREFEMLSAIPFSLLGAMSSIAKVIIYTVAMIVEVIGTIFVYSMVEQFLMAIPSLLETPFAAIIDGGAGKTGVFNESLHADGWLTLIMLLLSSIITLMFTMMALKMRKSVLAALNEAVTGLVNKFLEVQVATPQEAGNPLGHAAKGFGHGAGIGLGHRRMARNAKGQHAPGSRGTGHRGAHGSHSAINGHGAGGLANFAGDHKGAIFGAAALGTAGLASTAMAGSAMADAAEAVTDTAGLGTDGADARGFVGDTSESYAGYNDGGDGASIDDATDARADQIVARGGLDDGTGMASDGSSIAGSDDEARNISGVVDTQDGTANDAVAADGTTSQLDRGEDGVDGENHRTVHGLAATDGADGDAVSVANGEDGESGLDRGDGAVVESGDDASTSSRDVQGQNVADVNTDGANVANADFASSTLDRGDSDGVPNADGSRDVQGMAPTNDGDSAGSFNSDAVLDRSQVESADGSRDVVGQASNAEVASADVSASDGSLDRGSVEGSDNGRDVAGAATAAGLAGAAIGESASEASDASNVSLDRSSESSRDVAGLAASSDGDDSSIGEALASRDSEGVSARDVAGGLAAGAAVLGAADAAGRSGDVASMNESARDVASNLTMSNDGVGVDAAGLSRDDSVSARDVAGGVAGAALAGGALNTARGESGLASESTSSRATPVSEMARDASVATDARSVDGVDTSIARDVSGSSSSESTQSGVMGDVAAGAASVAGVDALRSGGATQVASGATNAPSRDAAASIINGGSQHDQSAVTPAGQGESRHVASNATSTGSSAESTHREASETSREVNGEGVRNQASGAHSGVHVAQNASNDAMNDSIGTGGEMGAANIAHAVAHAGESESTRDAASALGAAAASIAAASTLSAGAAQTQAKVPMAGTTGDNRRTSEPERAAQAPRAAAAPAQHATPHTPRAAGSQPAKPGAAAPSTHSNHTSNVVGAAPSTPSRLRSRKRATPKRTPDENEVANTTQGEGLTRRALRRDGSNPLRRGEGGSEKNPKRGDGQGQGPIDV